VGRFAIHVETHDASVAFASQGSVVDGADTVSLTCRTEIDRYTYAPLYFHEARTRPGQETVVSAWASHDSIVGGVRINGDYFPSARKVPARTFLFEDFVMEHQIALFAAIADSETAIARFHVFRPSSFELVEGGGVIESEVEFPTRPKPTVCKKYSVMMQGIPSYEGYFDPDTRLPIYLDFSAGSTEVFLESAFGSEIPTRYGISKQGE
jgi:hypothetical protein